MGTGVGSIDRYHNKFGTPRAPANRILHKQQEAKLKSTPLLLNTDQRKSVETAIRDVCLFREWTLYAMNVRSNYGHSVVFARETSPENVLRDFKAYATRALRTAGLWKFDHSPWVDGGSKRYLWKETSLHNACDYVLNNQGGPLPETF